MENKSKNKQMSRMKRQLRKISGRQASGKGLITRLYNKGLNSMIEKCRVDPNIYQRKDIQMAKRGMKKTFNVT